jgi:hypothetical protein
MGPKPGQSICTPLKTTESLPSSLLMVNEYMWSNSIVFASVGIVTIILENSG